jgi:hypothetical protein
MQELRTRRSGQRDEAIGHLLDRVSRSYAGCGIALIDERGRLLAGAGTPGEMWAAVRAAQRGTTSSPGFVSAPIVGSQEPMRLAAFRVDPNAGMRRAAAGVARIMGSLE